MKHHMASPGLRAMRVGSCSRELFVTSILPACSTGLPCREVGTSWVPHRMLSRIQSLHARLLLLRFAWKGLKTPNDWCVFLPCTDDSLHFPL